MKNYKDIINLAVVNFKVAAGDKEKNLKRIDEYTKAAAGRGANLILFPELCLTGYDCFIDDNRGKNEKMKLAETLDGPACKLIEQTARKHDIYVVFGMAEKSSGDACGVDTAGLGGKASGDVAYNSAVAIGPEGVIGSYKKIHPFDAENKFFAKGETPFMFDTPWGPVSMGICYDTYQFPELMRYYVSKGSRLYLNPTAVIEEYSNHGSRQAFIDYYAPTLEYGVLANTVYIASSNLTGFDDFSFFGGGSAVIGPKVTPFFETNLHYYAGNKDNVQEEMFVTTVDLSLATRRLMDTSGAAGEPDYRPEIYKKFV